MHFWSQETCCFLFSCRSGFQPFWPVKGALWNFLVNKVVFTFSVFSPKSIMCILEAWQTCWMYCLSYKTFARPISCLVYFYFDITYEDTLKGTAKGTANLLPVDHYRLWWLLLSYDHTSCGFDCLVLIVFKWMRVSWNWSLKITFAVFSLRWHWAEPFIWSDIFWKCDWCHVCMYNVLFWKDTRSHFKAKCASGRQTESKRRQRSPWPKYFPSLHSQSWSSAHSHANEMTISVAKTSLQIKPPWLEGQPVSDHCRLVRRYCQNTHHKLLAWAWLVFWLAHVCGFYCLVTKGIVHRVAHQEGRWIRCTPKAKHHHDTSGDGKVEEAGKRKWKPAALNAHRVFKSFYDLKKKKKKKAKTNNRTFSIIYNSDVRCALMSCQSSVHVVHLLFCACSILFASICVFLCCLLSSIDTSEGETYQVPGTTKEQSIFVLSRLASYYLLFVSECFGDKKWNTYKLVHRSWGF